MLTDPNDGLVRVIDSESLEELRSIELEGLEGTPYTSSPSAAAGSFTDVKGPGSDQAAGPGLHGEAAFVVHAGQRQSDTFVLVDQEGTG